MVVSLNSRLESNKEEKRRLLQKGCPAQLGARMQDGCSARGVLVLATCCSPHVMVGAREGLRMRGKVRGGGRYILVLVNLHRLRVVPGARVPLVHLHIRSLSTVRSS